MDCSHLDPSSSTISTMTQFTCASDGALMEVVTGISPRGSVASFGGSYGLSYAFLQDIRQLLTVVISSSNTHPLWNTSVRGAHPRQTSGVPAGFAQPPPSPPARLPVQIMDDGNGDIRRFRFDTRSRAYRYRQLRS
ncbi:hypothetical protein DXG01_015467 [Tephrocybe rancida]|nr:hypothetical protein DXG01_015467 [Tephrocybe rancida]